MISAYLSAVGALSRALAIVATLLLIAAMLVVCEMIVIRYVLRAATIWQTDFVVFSATAAIFLGAPYVLMKGGHVGVDFIEHAVSPTARKLLKTAGGLLGLAFCAIMLVASAINVHEAYVGGWKHSSVWAPRLWIPMSALPIGFAALCLQYIGEILKVVTSSPEAARGVADEIAASGDAVTAHALKERAR
ncbi:TRAP transporter small permease [Chelatococcus sambhunathii]|uniref:TRAP transporter small permease protein n=1 Tax=Chelatococcus sambhunathii TaxID=363953 RepID=A0ABU1DJC5_9HYPH|nr:TRAP transporter small permease [Chelatococcus sambhunathii]MDR4307985.1 TRAP transporter small permease [Chelatococcus sambhunathii]